MKLTEGEGRITLAERREWEAGERELGIVLFQLEAKNEVKAAKENKFNSIKSMPPFNLISLIFSSSEKRKLN